MSGGFDLSGYVTVNERLARALKQWPELRVQETPPRLVDANGTLFVEVTTTVWRTPDDPLPAVASIWEPFPGVTPYTRNSEAANASTSALGRALGLMGVAIDTAMASADEVNIARNRNPDPLGDDIPGSAPTRTKPGSAAKPAPTRPTGGRPPSEKALGYLRKLAREAGDTLTDDEAATLTAADVAARIDRYLGK